MVDSKIRWLESARKCAVTLLVPVLANVHMTVYLDGQQRDYVDQAQDISFIEHRLNNGELFRVSLSTNDVPIISSSFAEGNKVIAIKEIHLEEFELRDQCLGTIGLEIFISSQDSLVEVGLKDSRMMWGYKFSYNVPASGRKIIFTEEIYIHSRIFTSCGNY